MSGAGEQVDKGRRGSKERSGRGEGSFIFAKMIDGIYGEGIWDVISNLDTL